MNPRLGTNLTMSSLDLYRRDKERVTGNGMETQEMDMKHRVLKKKKGQYSLKPLILYLSHLWQLMMSSINNQY